MKTFFSQNRVALLLILGTVLFSSCASNQLISNGAYSDISLDRTSDQYELKRLNEVNAEGSSFFGIPSDESVGNKYGMVVRFNGVDIAGTKRIVPILTLLATTFAVGTLVQDLAGDKTDGELGVPEPKLDLGLSMIAGLPVAGIINNFAWGQMTSTSRAFQKFNRRLVEDNSGVDVFLNPRYEIQQNVGLFSTKTKVKGRVMGARLITD